MVDKHTTDEGTAGEIDLGIEGLTDYREIGVGGFATVYAATEAEYGRRVAVKVFTAMTSPVAAGSTASVWPWAKPQPTPTS